MKTSPSRILNTAKIIVLALILGTGLHYIFADWTPAPLNAPSGNVEAPVNLSGLGQIKAGGLTLGTDSSVTNGLLVLHGNVGIGTANPTQKLYVVGDVCAEVTTGVIKCLSQLSDSLATTPQAVTWYFGGMIGSLNGKVNSVTNPLNGNLASCPPYYNKYAVIGTVNVDYPLSVCVGRSDTGATKVGTFGGMYGIGTNVTYTNLYTGTSGCPSGFTSKQVMGTTNVDYTLYYCYNTSTSAAPAGYEFGGMFGSGTSGTYETYVQYMNPVSGTWSCPPGYTQKQTYGTVDVDYGVFYCKKS